MHHGSMIHDKETVELTRINHRQCKYNQYFYSTIEENKLSHWNINRHGFHSESTKIRE